MNYIKMEWNIMTNFTAPVINKVKFSYFLRWAKFAVSSLWLNPWRLLLLSAGCLPLFLLIFVAGNFIQSSFIIVTIASLGLSLIFPILLAALAIVARRLRQQQPVLYRVIVSEFWHGANLRLIFVYALLVLFFSLSCNYLLFLIPEYKLVLSYALEVILAILQIIMLIAIPLNTQFSGKPFHVLAYSTRAFVINFVPCMLFLLMVLLILFGAIALAKLAALLIGTWALIIYVLELWLFVTWLGLATANMSHDLFTINV